MNELQIFKNERFGEIRTVLKNNEPFFCLKDVCDILGIGNPSDVKTRLNESGVVTIEVGINTGLAVQKIKMNFIDESNFYKCIFQSRKPDAEQITDWVAREVLPTIRKTGSYSIQNPVEALLENPVKLGEMLIEYGKAKEQLKIQAPKVQTYEMLYESDAVVDIGEVSKTLNFKGVGRNNLFAILRQQGILNSNNEPYQEYVNRGYFKLIPTNYVDNFGNRKMKVVAYMKGVEVISKLLLKLGYVKINPNYSMAIN
jgi:toxin-antitoxin system, toxin component, bro family